MSRGDASPLDRIAERERSIEAIADSKPLDVMALRSISRSKGGFTSGRMRRLVWPKLLGINTKSRLEDFKKFISDSKDDIQVSVDIERSLWNYEVTKMWPDKYRDARRKVLSGIITGILCKNKGLHYYQGFHDWVSVILIVLENDNLAFAVADRMSTRFLSDYLKPDFEVVSKMMRILFVILKVADRQLHQFLHDAKMEPFFATSWLLTWFSHDLKSVDEIARIFDALLCSHPLFSFYVCAVVRLVCTIERVAASSTITFIIMIIIVITITAYHLDLTLVLFCPFLIKQYVVSLKKEIMKVECEFAAVYNVLVHAPSQYGFDFENLLPLADDLFRRIPPHKLGPQCDSELTQLIYNKQ